MPIKRGVVAVDTDGSIKWYFETRTKAENALKVCHKSMGHALKDHSLHVRGYAWYYEEDYRNGWFEFGESHFAWQPDPNRERFVGGFVKGHKANLIYKLTEKGRKVRSETARMVCMRRKENGSYAIQAEKRMKPVRCVDDGNVFKSVKHCGEYYGIPSHQISAAIIRNGKVRKMKFEFV